MHITDAFDGGNIICRRADDPRDMELEIRKDNNADFYQWFHFRLTGARGQECIMRITNAGGAAYPQGWEHYRAVASYDRTNWFRVATSYRDGVLTIRHRPDRDTVRYAYFAPYSMERHADMVARCLGDPRVRLVVPGRTLDGQDMDILTIGEPAPHKKQIWILARQHPGETMAEWLVEGLLDRLLDRADPVAGALRDDAVVHVVPNMNPDGSRRGHLRTNAAGANLNREWENPSMDKSPEVQLVRDRMDAVGVDLCLDVHGDEILPHNFIAGSEGIPDWNDARDKVLQHYKSTLATANPDFQTAEGYPRTPAGKANPAMCTNQIAMRYGALAMTLEQPFKDCNDRPDPVFGWSPARAAALGRSNLDAMLATLPLLQS